MDSLREFRFDSGTEAYRTAILLGIVSVPFTVGVNGVLASGTVDATPLFIACVISGYLYEPRPTRGTSAGAVTALVGGVPILLWQSGTTLVEWWEHPLLADAVGDSWALIALSVGGAAATLVLGVGVLLLVGTLGGGIGAWTNDRLGRTERLGAEA